MNVFEEIKAILDAETVAKFYGIEAVRGNKAICPFHPDKHPSMSFKGTFYRCFACNTGGDLIDFVCRLFGLSNIEAAKKLNTDFNLGLSLDKPIPAQRIREIEHDNQLYKAFEEWEKSAFITLSTRIHQLEGYKRDFSPKEPDNYPPLYTEACLYLDYTIYLWDCLFEADFTQKLNFYSKRHLKA